MLGIGDKIKNFHLSKQFKLLGLGCKKIKSIKLLEFLKCLTLLTNSTVLLLTLF